MILSLSSIALAGMLMADTATFKLAPDTVTRTRVSPVVTFDTVRGPIAGSTEASHPTGKTGNKAGPRALSPFQQADTIPKRRAAVHYSDAYGTRANIHRRLSYAMLPLFALSYFTGDKLFNDGPNASSTVRNLHRISATSVTALFTVNTVTGGINLWQGRHDPIERKRKLVHSALFIAAGAGFAYSGAVLANDAETSLAKRRDHRTLNLVSIGLSTSSVLVMMVGRD